MRKLVTSDNVSIINDIWFFQLKNRAIEEAKTRAEDYAKEKVGQKVRRGGVLCALCMHAI